MSDFMVEELKEVREQDLEQVLPVLYQLSPQKEEDKNVSQDELRKILAKIISDDNYFMYVLEVEGNIVGIGSLLIQLNLSHGGKPYGHIENVVVDNLNRKNGTGKKIVAKLIEKAKEKGCYKIVLACEANNIPFYEKSGLNETGEVEMRLDF
ncbi:MAG: histone acetyltransferase [Candidatus Diapherotrites archaeon]|uniref:Histone acetyltransferase n=1 Tax=Candidatus Iainarchaeum sp. TaxID=3101447 RepID=A0A2D6M129_9ARCH|nr:histone acetyltransferase [Candidatus Diapherotrites archaeon]